MYFYSLEKLYSFFVFSMYITFVPDFSYIQCLYYLRWKNHKVTTVLRDSAQYRSTLYIRKTSNLEFSRQYSNEVKRHDKVKMRHLFKSYGTHLNMLYI